MDNYYGRLKVPAVNLSLEQFILILYPSFLIPAVYFWYTHLVKRRTEASQPYGCVRLGLDGPSHMTDQYEEKYDLGTTDESQWRVKAIHIHPIKSCAPVELDEVEIEGSGMTWDRKFVFAELFPSETAGKSEGSVSHHWKFRTLRAPGFEKLALVKPEVWLPRPTTRDPSTLRRIQRTGALVIKFPNVPTGALAFLDRLFMRLGLLPRELSFQVPLIPPADVDYPREAIQIWNDNPIWLNMSMHVPDNFRTYINPKRQFTLFRVDPNPESYRKVYGNAPRREELGYQPTVGANDAYPLHLLNLASVHDVGGRIKEAIPEFSARRFRSNILVVGPPAYDEDDWKKITVTSSVNGKESKHLYHCVCRALRCRLPNVDPDSGIRHPNEPDKILKSFRCIDEGDLKNAALGLHLVPADMHESGGKVNIRVGDRITVDERGEHVHVR